MIDVGLAPLFHSDLTAASRLDDSIALRPVEDPASLDMSVKYTRQISARDCPICMIESVANTEYLCDFAVDETFEDEHPDCCMKITVSTRNL